MSKNNSFVVKKRHRFNHNSYVCKRNDLIQQARFELTVTEQRIILYTISKIKPDDTAFQQYKFDIKEFYELCNIEKDSYNVFKRTLKTLADKSWWAIIDDKGTEKLMRWFSDIEISQHSIVTIEFHPNMFPFLINLKQQATQGLYYTQYELQNILPMRSKYSIKLYELLKSYQKNNEEWFFDIDHLKRLLDCSNYEKFGMFKARILDTGIKEINEFTDLNIDYTLIKEGNRYRWITFSLQEKTAVEKINVAVNQSVARMNKRTTTKQEATLNT